MMILRTYKIKMDPSNMASNQTTSVKIFSLIMELRLENNGKWLYYNLNFIFYRITNTYIKDGNGIELSPYGSYQ